MMLAGVVEMGKLVQQRDWNGQVASLKREASRLGFFGSSAAARRAIGEALIAAVENRAGTAGKFGVLLSGGIDSSFIAFILKKLGLRFTCFCVGVSGSKDLAAARVAARKLKATGTPRRSSAPKLLNSNVSATSQPSFSGSEPSGVAVNLNTMRATVSAEDRAAHTMGIE